MVQPEWRHSRAAAKGRYNDYCAYRPVDGVIIFQFTSVILVIGIWHTRHVTVFIDIGQVLVDSVPTPHRGSPAIVAVLRVISS